MYKALNTVKAGDVMRPVSLNEWDGEPKEVKPLRSNTVAMESHVSNSSTRTSPSQMSAQQLKSRITIQYGGQEQETTSKNDDIMHIMSAQLTSKDLRGPLSLSLTSASPKISMSAPSSAREYYREPIAQSLMRETAGTPNSKAKKQHLASFGDTMSPLASPRETHLLPSSHKHRGNHHHHDRGQDGAPFHPPVSAGSLGSFLPQFGPAKTISSPTTAAPSNLPSRVRDLVLTEEAALGKTGSTAPSGGGVGVGAGGSGGGGGGGSVLVKTNTLTFGNPDKPLYAPLTPKHPQMKDGSGSGKDISPRMRALQVSLGQSFVIGSASSLASPDGAGGSSNTGGGSSSSTKS
jgi:hypothetical protein